jgi:hypothetical protein
MMAGPSTAVSVVRLASYGGAYEFFAGRIDDVRVYDRALTAAEITALAQGR